MLLAEMTSEEYSLTFMICPLPTAFCLLPTALLRLCDQLTKYERQDAAEGIAASLEKRKPEFKGK